MRELISRQVVLAEVKAFLDQRDGIDVSPVMVEHLIATLKTIPVETALPSGVDGLKQALRKVRQLCVETQYCADCPLCGKERCFAWDDEAEPLQYPAEWPLEWPQSTAQGSWTESVECSECGELALYNGNEELVRSRFCPHCGAKMGGGLK